MAQSRRAPAGFIRLIDGCLAPTPADWPSVAELTEELDAIVGD
jgi:hypothetical protein